MKFAPRPLLLAFTALLACGTALANDAPKAEAAKPDAAKADAHKAEAPKDGAAKDAAAAKPAEADLPSRPYPKNVSPKAFSPKKGEQVAAKDAGKPAEKLADKPAETARDKHADAHDAVVKGAEKGAEKPVEKPADKVADKDAVKLADSAAEPMPPRRAPRPRRPAVVPVPKPVADLAMASVAGDYLRHSASGGTYRVKPGDNLDTVIRKSVPDSPFSPAVMREAFVRANPQLQASGKALRLKPGAMLNLPDAAVLRQVVLGQSALPEPPAAAPVAVTAAVPTATVSVTPAAVPGSQPGTTSGTSAAMPPVADATPPAPRAAIAVPPLRPDTASSGPAQPVPPEEKKKWVHFP